MKLSKKAMKRAQIILNTFVVLLMLIQPVGTPSLMLALAADSTDSTSSPQASLPQADEPTAEKVAVPDPAPDPAPKEEPKAEPVAPAEKPAIEAPAVEEAAPAVTEEVALVADPVPADEPTVETVSEDAPADVSTGEAISTEVQNQVDTITGAVTDGVPTDSAIADPSVHPEEGLITPEAASVAAPDAPADNNTQVENGTVDAIVVDNVKANTLDLDAIDPNNVEETAKLATDKADYAPTDTAIITGTGFNPDETYTLVISSKDNPPVTKKVDVTADENGEFVYAYQLDGNYRPDYKVEARNDSGKVVAEVTFTDSLSITSATVNGIANVTVAPGASVTADVRGNLTLGSVWHGTRWRISNTPPGTTNCADTLNHDSNGTNFDSGNFTITAPSTTGTYNAYFIMDSSSSCSGSASSYFTLANAVTVALPDLTSVKTNDVSGNVVLGNSFNWNIRVQNSGLTDATFVGGRTIFTDNLPSSGATYGSITITKVDGTVTGTINCSINVSKDLICSSAAGGVVIPANKYFDISFSVTPSIAGTLSNPRSGSGNMCRVDRYDNVTESNESNNDCSNTVTVTNTGTIKVVKHVINDNGGTTTASNFSIHVKNGASEVSGSPAAGSETGKTYTLNAGTYTLSETGGPAGYSASAWACTGGGTQNGSQITIAAGDNAICTIINDDIQPKITVTKIVNGGTAQVSDFPLFVGTNPVTSGVQSDINAGTYNVHETNQTGYTGVITGNCASNGNITFNPGDIKSCTITNTRDTGSIQVNKLYDDDADNDFERGNSSANTLGFRWGIDAETPARNMGSTASGIETGDYTITENNGTIPDYHFVGWFQTDDWRHSCSHPEGTTLPVNLSVSKNHTTEITLCNAHDAGTITVIKSLNPSNDPGRFDLMIDGSIRKIHAKDGDSTGTQTVITGNHSVSEIGSIIFPHTNINNYVSSIECINGETIIASGSGTSLYGIVVNSGDNIICTITNSRKGSITIVKNTAGGDGTFNFDSNFGVTSLDTSGGTASQTVDNLAPGTDYNISETVPTGWDQNSATCDHGTIDAIEVLAGQTTTCTFINTKRGSISGYKWSDLNGDGQWGGGEVGLTGWTIFIDEDEKNGVLDSGEQSDVTDYYGSAPGYYSFGNLIPGSYSVCEEEQTGWSRTSPADSNCQDVTVDPGQSVANIDFGNVQMGKIIIEKQTLPDGSAQSFEFTPNYAKGTFSLTDGQQNGSEYLVPGTYSVSETAVDGWDLTSADCVSGNGNQTDRAVNIEQADSISPDNINLNPGETVTCTFTNTKRGRITIAKTTDIDTDKTFAFTPSYGANFGLGRGDSNTSELLVPGEYTVEEHTKTDWELNKVVCVDASQNSTASKNGRIETIDLVPGGDITCTFTNDHNSTGGGGGGGGAATTGGGGPLFTGGGIIGPAGAIGGGASTASGEEVQGEATPGAVQGEQTSCASWPLWVWILALIVYGGAFNWRSFYNLSGQRHKRFAWQIIFTVGALAFWYYFDFCRIYTWFPVIAVVGGLLSLWYYIYRFGRTEHIA